MLELKSVVLIAEITLSSALKSKFKASLNASNIYSKTISLSDA